MERFDCIVVGAGPAGAALSVGLKARGLKVLLVEASKTTVPVFKGEFIQSQPLKTLVGLGFGAIQNTSSSQHIYDLRFRDLNARGEAVSDVLMEFAKDSPALAISHFDLLTSLRAHCAQVLGEDFVMGAQLTPLNQDSPDFLQQPQFNLKVGEQVRQITARWVVGCDGRNSSVRKWIKGQPIIKNGPVTTGVGPEMIVGLELKHQAPQRQRYEVLRTFGEGTISAFSLGEHGQRVYYSSPMVADPMKATWVKNLQKISKDIEPYIQLGEVGEGNRVQGFPAFTHYFTKELPGRFLLVGDSVGVTTPYGGQGITAVMEHVSYLLNSFDWSTWQAYASDIEKGKYLRQTVATHERIALLNFGLYFLFFSREPMMKKATQHITSAWNRDPGLRQEMMLLFGGIDTTKPSIMRILRLWGLTPSTGNAIKLLQGLRRSS